MFSAWIEAFWETVLQRWPAGLFQPSAQPAFAKPAPLRPEPEVLARDAPLEPDLVLDEAETDDADGDAEAGEVEVEDWPVLSPEEIAAARAQAEAQALSGPHRIFPSSSAGPGSLSEALKRLEAAGRVACDFIDDPSAGPHLAYRPV